MEIPESSVESSNLLTKDRSKKSRKSKKTIPPSSTDSLIPHDGELSNRKRKSESQSGQKKKKKNKKHEHEDNKAESDADEDSTALNGNGLSLQDTEKGAITNKKRVSKSRMGGKHNLKVGFFTKTEVEALEAHKVRFCNMHNFTSIKFDEMVQHSERSGDDWPCLSSICTKTEFWNEIYDIIPDRDRRSVYRFMRRHFQDSMQKPHDWTPEQDRELIDLVEKHGPKYAFIAKFLGRSDDDVTQRWKNRLEHRKTMRYGGWTEPEITALLGALEDVWNALRSTAPDIAGKDIYEMEEKFISWSNVSNAMKNVRSRQQCADKWRKTRQNVLTIRATTDPDAVFDPKVMTAPSSRWGASMNVKSSQYVADAEDSENEGPSIPVTTPRPESTNKKQQLDLANVAEEGSIEDSSAESGDEEEPRVISSGRDNTKKQQFQRAYKKEAISDEDSDSDDSTVSSTDSDSDSDSDSDNDSNSEAPNIKLESVIDSD
ncbi:hypothetical protein N7462_002486 [Penicillium macrosclerotiorum]|uniref:uncharacterized protein n=1 Tax=Penicillium macrosclerotiorum TaxID=303699 RepID=UPI002547A756|nr:uncharacterized protein N7462_002486 [Penicillium macrosclerotiorum]KAJ5693063.1 hypothetical protein N7462_002486 [Penicillium macrosclerotiorum]